jgi:hypothetical protein
MSDFTLAESVAEIHREIAVRKRVYPQWTADGRLTQDKADRQIVQLEAAATLTAAPATGGNAPDGPPVLATNWRPVNRGALIANADLVIPRWRTVFYSCGLFRQNGKEWVSLPSKEWTDSGGKKRYFEAVAFCDLETNKRFQAAALAAFLILEREQRESRAPVPAQPLSEALLTTVRTQGGRL